MPILIDGYNLLFQTGLVGKGRGPGFLERARHALVRVIAAGLDKETVRDTTVVFDAKQAPYGSTPQQIECGLTVLYAAGYDDADALIEEFIRRAAQPRRLLVVSSDHRVQQAAKRRRARYMGAEEWFEQLQRTRKSAALQEIPEKPQQPSDEELDYWRSVFAGITDEVLLPEEPPAADEPPSPPPAPSRQTKDGVDLDDLDDPFPPGYAERL